MSDRIREEKPWVACLDCLRGSIIDRNVDPVVAECQVCHDVRPCLPGERVALFVPFIPLGIYEDESEPINDKNRCAACKGKGMLLSVCGSCLEAKCWHLMKPCSPHCLACTANAS